MTWPELLEYVRQNLRTCRTPEQRIRYLTDRKARRNALSVARERKLGERRAEDGV